MAKSLVGKAPIFAKQLIESSKPKLDVFLKYAKVELTPPSARDIPRIQQGISDIVSAARTGKWKQLTVKEAWLNTLVAVEVICWFYIGECIGKRHFVGYDI